MLHLKRYYIVCSDGVYGIKDNATGDIIGNADSKSSCDGICDLLNKQNNWINCLENEVGRLEVGLYDIDVNLGLLSMLVDERFDDAFDKEKLKDISHKLSVGITEVMFPKCRVEKGE